VSKVGLAGRVARSIARSRLIVALRIIGRPPRSVR
jgi:hypothetical protein